MYKDNMKTYNIYLKSRCEVPDYEDTCKAESYLIAADIFAKRINNQTEDCWTPEDLLEYIEERREGK